ncbi:hypothetical protein ACWCQS_32295 [Streptomyces sp. NPDC002076]
MTFTLRAANIIDPKRYTVYSNAPVVLTKEDRQKADAALLELLTESQDVSASDEREQRDTSNGEGSASGNP